MYADFWYLFQVDKSVIKDLQILKKKVTEHACVFDTYVTVKLDCGNWACDVYIHAVALKKKKKFLSRYSVGEMGRVLHLDDRTQVVNPYTISKSLDRIGS